jgi:hypothetical protein
VPAVGPLLICPEGFPSSDGSLGPVMEGVAALSAVVPRLPRPARPGLRSARRFAMVTGTGLVQAGRSPAVRAVGIVYPPAVLGTVVAIANHDVLDGIAGALERWLTTTASTPCRAASRTRRSAASFVRLYGTDSSQAGDLRRGSAGTSWPRSRSRPAVRAAWTRRKTYALTLVGVPLAPALLGAFTYRLFNFWLPLLPALAVLPTLLRLGGRTREEAAAGTR